ncbi:hypothetical protein [Nocardioides aurantiacus]|uniref:CcmD family protein n=1 Tax=Nocardioides aurantiacus TaxID=86796 RepID=A0A3N2CYR4_9ACTN|nr:hypothetical protein [Nocardioides aurantiacus]ROR92334.1 hypothetical protein EDD33_3223 [Nocardioides aurantiacus]
MTVLLTHALLLLPAADPVPEPEDVKAGWLAFWIFVALCAATALLCVSLTRHLRKIRENTAAGKFGADAQAAAAAEAEEREAARLAWVEAQRPPQRQRPVADPRDRTTD